MDLQANLDLIYQLIEKLKIKKPLYLKNKIPTPFSLLTPEEQKFLALQELQKQKDLDLELHLNFNTLLREYKNYKRNLFKLKNSEKSELYFTIYY